MTICIFSLAQRWCFNNLEVPYNMHITRSARESELLGRRCFPFPLIFPSYICLSSLIILDPTAIGLVDGFWWSAPTLVRLLGQTCVMRRNLGEETALHRERVGSEHYKNGRDQLTRTSWAGTWW